MPIETPAASTAIQDSPRASGFRVPAEWEPHRAVWTAWPAAADLWEDGLAAAQKEFTALCHAIAGSEMAGAAIWLCHGPTAARTGASRGHASDLEREPPESRGHASDLEREPLASRGHASDLQPELLEILVADETAEREATAALSGLAVRFHRIPYGDIWLRDTAPVFSTTEAGEVAAVCFRFNGWGDKYLFTADLALARAVRLASGLHSFDVPMIFEGGAIELDGEGTAITTSQCLMNPNRNPAMSKAGIESHLVDALGVDKVIWLGDGLLNDHTDGHVDTIVRFAGPGRVLCMEARDDDDPNREVLEAIASDLSTARDASGRSLEIVRIPSPGLIESADGEPMAASYVNYYIANTTVVVPTYGSRYDEEAVRTIASCFPGRRTVGTSARAILSGGGAFHCITQQEPCARVAGAAGAGRKA
jgi:agmatine deiminase